MQPNTVVAEIATETGLIKVRALVDGFIVEFNEALLTQPRLLQDSVRFVVNSAGRKRLRHRGDASSTPEPRENGTRPQVLTTDD